MSIDKNLFPLNMVKSELDMSLLQIVGSLEAIDENQKDIGKLEQCIAGFIQLKGVFQIINMHECSLIAQSLLEACKFSIDVEDDEQRYDILSKISSAIVILTHYLEYSQAREESLPVLLLASINELRSIVNHKPLNESYFFDLDLSSFDLNKIKNIIDVNPISSRLRQMYQLGLIGIFNEQNASSHFKIMERALIRFNSLYPEQGLGDVFRIFHGALDSFISGGVKLSTERKLFFGRIDRYIKTLFNSDVSKLSEEATLLLIKDCLYFVALSDRTSELLISISNDYGLERFNLDDAYINRERDLMSGPSSSVIYAVSSALHEEIAIIKDQLDVISRSSAEKKHEQLNELHAEFKKIEYTLSMLSLNECGEKLNVLISSLESNDGSEDFNNLLQGFADILIYIEHSISHLGKRNKPEQSDAKALKPSLELDEVYSFTIKESRKMIAGVQYSLSTFAENNFNENYLDKAVENLRSAWGGIYFLNKGHSGRSADQLAKSADYIEQKILGYEKITDIQKLHTLADVLASIDYYLEGLENRSALMEGALEIADAGLAELGFDIEEKAFDLEKA